MQQLLEIVAVQYRLEVQGEAEVLQRGFEQLAPVVAAAR